ncbi:hypothetical protein ACLI09_01330 [Flavobacterium sp. RHBU_24]|uniref:hypothetical protein n=1 Tax=Flavobacterium sp. RHBU_24 TaxID=3391185 RepID=UPI0039846B77
MSEKKNIDRLFQEKFKDFEADPPEYVWNNIHDALQEKKKRRILPLWWRYGGVAAVLVLGALFSLPYIGGPGNDTNPVVTAPKHNPTPGSTITAPGIIQDDAHNSDGSDAVQYTTDAVAGADGINPDRSNAANDKATANGHKAHEKINHPNRTIKNGADNNAIAGTAHDAIVTKQRRRGTKRVGSIIATDNQNAVAAANGGKNNTYRTITNDGNNADAAGKSGNLNNPGQQGNEIDGQVTDSQAAVADGTTGRDNQNNNEGGVIDNLAVIDTIANQAIAEAIIDTTKIKPENELEKLLKEQQENKKDEQIADNSNKWSIRPQLAPVFYNSLSQGSPIDAQFASNTKSYETDLSLGLGVNYALNKRLHIRGGINTVNLNYATQGVEFYASLEGGTNNVSATAKSANIVVQDQGSAPSVNPVNVFSSQLSSNNAFAGSMVQQTGYVEVPLEMSYALVDNKFGINVIGGVSTLFLNQNNVSVISTQGLSTRVGEAQNLNNIHFSTNVGVGFRYRFFKAFEASFEPTFKYQVNTFSRDAGNFKPYFVGLYSGISFSF